MKNFQNRYAAVIENGSWGPVSGSDATVDPFENSRYRLENAILISEYKDDYEKRIAAIKLAIAEYGAVTFQYNNAHNYEYYNPKKAAILIRTPVL